MVRESASILIVKTKFLKLIGVSGLCASLLAGYAGCGGKTGETTVPSAESAGADESSERRFPLKGTVVEADGEAGTALVNHEEIPGFMGAMTMQFSVDPEIAKTLQPNQKISATLVQGADGFRLENVEAVKP